MVEENAADRSMKAMSWKVVDVVVFAIGEMLETLSPLVLSLI